MWFFVHLLFQLSYSDAIFIYFDELFDYDYADLLHSIKYQ